MSFSISGLGASLISIFGFGKDLAFALAFENGLTAFCSSVP